MMKTNYINHWLLLAIAALFTASCSEGLTEPLATSNRGSELPVSVSATHTADATTRAEYNAETKKISFTEYDKLLVEGTDATAGDFYGQLDYNTTSGKFEGTITTANVVANGNALDIFKAASEIEATLVPAGHETIGFLGITGETSGSKVIAYPAKAFIAYTGEYAEVPVTKADAIEQLGHEVAYEYNNGFALEPQNAIIEYTITGLEAYTEYTVNDPTSNNPSGTVNADGNGVITFAIGVEPNTTGYYNITVNGYQSNSLHAELYPGKVYKYTYTAIESGAKNLEEETESTITLEDGSVIYGTLSGNKHIQIADGAIVTLKNVTIDGSANTENSHAGITCLGNATIIFEGTNKIHGFGVDYPGIQAGPENTTLTLKSNSGTGVLNAYHSGGELADNSSCGIGGGKNIKCGNIVIESGIITAEGIYGSAGIGSGGAYAQTESATSSCGNITISGGTVNATGGSGAAGIGSGNAYVGEDSEANVTATSSCGKITISGGTVIATGGQYAAAIGGGWAQAKLASATTNSTCTDIDITSGVTKVVATKGLYAIDYIGEGDTQSTGTAITGVTGKITIDGVENPDFSQSPSFTHFTWAISTSEALQEQESGNDVLTLTHN